MDKYQKIMIPKSTNVSIKIFFLDMFDVFALFIGGMAGQQVSFLFNLQPTWQLVLTAFGVVVGILLVMRTPLAPKIRNYRVLLSIMRQDQSKYYPLFLEGENNANKKKK